MDTFYNWHQIRGLFALAILGLFMLYALLPGSWQYWKAKRQAKDVSGQDDPYQVDSDKARVIDERRPDFSGRFSNKRTARAGKHERHDSASLAH